MAVAVASVLVFFSCVLMSLFSAYAVVRFGSTWRISKRWHVPWSWQTMIGVLLSVELSTPAILQYWSSETNIEVVLKRLIIDTVVGLALIFGLVIYYWPLPPGLFYLGISNPFGLEEGWLLWAIIGFICAQAATTATMVATYYLSLKMRMTHRGAKRPRRRGAMRKAKTNKRNDSERHVRHVDQVVCSSEASKKKLQVLSFLLPPLLEEYTYRGFLMASIANWLPTPIAVVISSVVFAVVHRSFERLPYLFSAGLVLGLIYAQTRNLMTSMAMHAWWNYLAVK